MLVYTIWPVIVAGVSVVMDIREARIDNGWICFSMCMGFILQLLQGGAGSLIPFAAGTAVPLMCLAILTWEMIMRRLKEASLRMNN